MPEPNCVRVWAEMYQSIYDVRMHAVSSSFFFCCNFVLWIPPRIAPSSCACHMPSKHPTSSASSWTSWMVRARILPLRAPSSLPSSCAFLNDSSTPGCVLFHHIVLSFPPYRGWSTLSPLPAWGLLGDRDAFLCSRDHPGPGTYAQSLCGLSWPQGETIHLF